MTSGGSSIGTSGGTPWVGIAELVEICDEQSATNLGWFVALGERVRAEPDPRRQRWCAMAAHRHAWHAELWASRRPAVPHDAIHDLPAPAVPAIDDDPTASYRAHTARQRVVLDRLRGRLDPDLDPSTLRVLALVEADLADLVEQLP